MIKVLGLMSSYFYDDEEEVCKEIIIDVLSRHCINFLDKENCGEYADIELDSLCINGDMHVNYDFENYIEVEFDIQDLDNNNEIDYDKVKITKKKLPRIESRIVKFKEFKDNKVLYTVDKKFCSGKELELYDYIELEYNKDTDKKSLIENNLLRYGDNDLNIDNKTLKLKEEEYYLY